MWLTTSQNKVSPSQSTREMPVSTHSDSSTPTLVTPSLLRDWPLPAPGEDKYSRGAVLVIGGARATPPARLCSPGPQPFVPAREKLPWPWPNP